MSLQSDVLHNAIFETESRIKRDETMLRSLHQLLQELMPLVDRIRNDLRDSTTRMPDVSKQLSSVTQATESATVEILNVIEAMSTTVMSAQTSLSSARKNYESRIAISQKLDEIISTMPNGELTSLWQEYKNVGSNTVYIEHLEQMLAQTSEQTMNIAMALQVQDITSQQIAGATHLIEQVEARLHTALRQFESPGESQGNSHDEKNVIPQLTFDSGAEYTKDTSRQTQADEITKEFLGK